MSKLDSINKVAVKIADAIDNGEFDMSRDEQNRGQER